MRNHVPFVTRLAALTGALTLTLLAVLVPPPARALCPEVIDINCFWTGGGHCLTSGCRSRQPSFCTGSQTGTVTCHTSSPYPCCQPG
jgi:hypothetical protein